MFLFSCREGITDLVELGCTVVDIRLEGCIEVVDL